MSSISIVRSLPMFQDLQDIRKCSHFWTICKRVTSLQQTVTDALARTKFNWSKLLALPTLSPSTRVAWLALSHRAHAIASLPCWFVQIMLSVWVVSTRCLAPSLTQLRIVIEVDATNGSISLISCSLEQQLQMPPLPTFRTTLQDLTLKMMKSTFIH